MFLVLPYELTTPLASPALFCHQNQTTESGKAYYHLYISTTTPQQHAPLLLLVVVVVVPEKRFSPPSHLEVAAFISESVKRLQESVLYQKGMVYLAQKKPNPSNVITPLRTEMALVNHDS